MKVHVSSVCTIFVVLLFVSGTVGCRNTGGGPWYNPSTYSLVNPFDKENKTPKSPYSSDAPERAKPSLAAQPNISPAPGGYTDGTSLAARSDTLGGSVSTAPPEHWGTSSPIASQGTPGPYGGYTIPEPSQYAPQQYQQGMYDGQNNVPASYDYYRSQSQSPSQQYPTQQNPPVNQPVGGNTMPYNVSPTYGAGQIIDSGNPLAYQQNVNNVPVDNFAMNQSSAYSTNAAVPPTTAAVPSGFGGYEQQPIPSSHPNEGVSVATPYQSYPLPATGGYGSF